MSVGRIELIDGKKQYSEYAGGGVILIPNQNTST